MEPHDLCAYHHERGVHEERTICIRGRAPGELAFALGLASECPERYRSGDLRDDLTWYQAAASA